MKIEKLEGGARFRLWYGRNGDWGGSLWHGKAKCIEGDWESEGWRLYLADSADVCDVGASLHRVLSEHVGQGKKKRVEITVRFV